MAEATTALPDWRDADRSSRDRLREIGSRLRASGAGTTRLADGWSAAAAIAHIGVWDSMTAARWRDAGGAVPDELPPGMVDFVNAGTLPLLAELSLDTAVAMAERGAAELEKVLGRVDDATLLEAYRLGRSNLVDRSRHRSEHLDAIEHALR